MDTDYILNELHGPKPTNYGKKWTKSDDKILVKMTIANKSIKDIMDKLDRTEGSIQMRIRYIQSFSIPVSTAKANRNHNTQKKGRPKSIAIRTKNNKDEPSNKRKRARSSSNTKNSVNTKKRRLNNNKNHSSNQCMYKIGIVIKLENIEDVKERRNVAMLWLNK